MSCFFNLLNDDMGGSECKPFFFFKHLEDLHLADSHFGDRTDHRCLTNEALKKWLYGKVANSDPFKSSKDREVALNYDDSDIFGGDLRCIMPC